MSNEEFEKKMEFIVDQQVQSAAKIGQLEAIVGRLASASLKRLELKLAVATVFDRFGHFGVNAHRLCRADNNNYFRFSYSI